MNEKKEKSIMQKIKQMGSRILAFTLALALSISPAAGTMTAYASETDDKEPPVKAHDIIKDISDTDFAVETCMEGIAYDETKETVTLSAISDEEGNAYDSNLPGTYVAEYLVVPKDESEVYFISRNVILTDTEGLAETQTNGGETQKTDTEESEESGEEEPMTETEITILSSVEEDAEALQALEEDIENGKVMLFSTASTSLSRSSSVSLVKGATIYYPSYLGSYFTCWFTVNGKVAYCIESHKSSPPSGDYVAEVLDTNTNLQKALYYGYGGAGDITGSYLSGYSTELKYIYTHIAASYAYAGTNAFAGCDYDALVQYGVIAYINKLFGMDEPPTGELELSKTSVSAEMSGDIQKISTIKLTGDSRNKITISLPDNVTGYNKTAGKSSTGGNLAVYGGDSFYFEAPLSVTGTFKSGKLYGSVGETWRTLVVSTGNGDQNIGVFESESASPVSFTVDWLEMTRISLIKKDAETGNPLSGAVYNIYTDKACSNLLMKMSATNTSGKTVSDYFDASVKTVYVKEIIAPENYILNETVYTVKVEAGKTISVEVENRPVKGEVYLHKIDVETNAFVSQGDATMVGAVYGLYAKSDIVHPDGKTGVLHKAGSLIVQGSVNAKGELSFKDLWLGEMFVKEISNPEGYAMDDTVYDATLTYGGQKKEIVTKEITVREQVMKQAFSLIKISEDGEQTEVNLVEKAGFKVYLIRSLSKVKDGTLKPGNGSYYMAEDFKNYDFTGESVAVLYENGQATPIQEMFTDSKGYLVSPELPYGSYVVEESTVPDNLLKVDPFVVNITKDSREPMTWRIFDDRPFQFLLKIVKKDAQTGKTVLGKEASYKIYDCDNKEYVEQTIYYPKREKISVFATTDEGYLLTPEKLKSGTYRIEEVKAPAGFVLAGSEEVLVSAGNEISLLEINTGGVYQKQAARAIEITVGSGTVHEVDPDSGIPIVTVEQKNNEQVGSLTVTKTGGQLQAVSGDGLFDKIVRGLSKVAEVFTGVDYDHKIFHKFVYADGGVSGAKFEIYAKEDIVSPDGAVDKDGNPVIRYRKDDLIAVLITEDGSAALNNLPLGSYYMKEVVAGENLVLNAEVKEFTISADNDTVAVVYEDVSYYNERQKIEVSIEKKDSVSKEAIAGVVFGLYAKEDIVSVQGEALVEKDTLIEQKATDEAGKLTFASDLPHGSYYVKELLRSPGYLPNETVWEVEITYQNQNESIVVKELAVENQPTETRLTKTDITSGEELEGATLQIINSDGEVVEAWVSTKEPHVVYALPEGEYILHEEIAPFQNGYVTAEDITFAVYEDGTVTEVEMKDDISKLDVSKSDLTTGDELKGAALQILDKDGNVLEEWVSTGKPHWVEKLPVGEELTLREIIAPKGFAVAEDITFTLDDTAGVQKVEMKDDYIYGKIRIEKTDSETGKALAGAKFEIRNKTTGEVEGTLTTDSKGVAESDKLLLGRYGTDGIKELFEYECVEVKAPEGYELDETPIPVSFELEKDSEPIITVTLEVKNKPIPNQKSNAPKTGDATNIIGLLGLVLASLSCITWILVRRKKKK